jgi:hypothetical protein
VFFRRESQRINAVPKTVLRQHRRHRRHSFLPRSLSHESLEHRQVLSTFQAMGPAAAIHGGTEKVSPDNEVSGAIHTVLTHPTNPDVMYIGSVNGGVWRTNNATAVRPHWVPLTDTLPSLSIGALAMDPNDPSRIVAGTARYSAFAEGGALTGLMLTEDAGATWRVINDPLLVGRNVSGVSINGDMILVSAGGGFYQSDPTPSGGLFRSTDGGNTWENLELFPRDANFPDEPIGFDAFDLVSDPLDAQRYYAAIADAGIFRTDDGGTNWSNVTSGDPRIDQLLQIIQTNNLDLNNMEMAVAGNGRIYAAIITLGQPLYIGYSDSSGGAWTEMDIPLTLETTGVVGISPRPKAGGQGNIHFSIIADPNDPYTVYVGGDRQDGDISFQYGNSIGARDFSGKLFRGDTRKASIGNILDPAGFIPFNGYSPQWEHLTHSNVAIDRTTGQPIMPEGGTRRGSAPHADSREMAFDANGQLIQVDDGGIYRRTSPRNNQGDWYSVNGDLQVAELHDIAYDSNANILLAGSQDNGAMQQLAANNTRWEVVEVLNQEIVGGVTRSSPGDGGDVAIDDSSISGHSIRYFSAQSLGSLRRQVYDSRNNLISEKLLTPNIIGNFVTPVVLNANSPSRIVIGGALGIFESFDRGDSFREVFGPGRVSFGVIGSAQVAVEYGGQRNGVGNPAVLYVASEGELFVRTQANEDMRLTRAQFTGGFIWDIALDTADWANAYVIDRDDVYVTTNTGDSWQKITGNLHTQGAGELRTIEFIRKGNGAGFVVVGTNTGAFVTSDSNPGQWKELGSLPHAPVFDMEYDAKDDVLAVGTMGRGAFLLRNAWDSARSAGSTATQQRTARGTVWKDLDGDGVRDGNEPPLSGITVYIDTNGDDQFGVSEPAAVTATNGSFAIGGVPSGSFAVRAVVQPGWVQTSPTGDGEYVVNFANQLQVTDLDFGIREGSGDEMGFDFGDAPGPFPTLLSSNGASHGIVAGFRMGQAIDGDLNGHPTSGADGDDVLDQDDDDGVSFVSDLVPGSSATLEVVIQNGAQPPGVLQGWIDFDGDHAWNTPGEQVFADRAVSPGTNVLTINVPSWAQLGETYARFRYGYERGISYRGRAVAGEVEDYLIEVIKGGPTAVDDDFVVRRNSIDNQLNVLTNDTLPPGLNTFIASVGPASAGGSVRIAPTGGSLIYTPQPGFTGTETLVYTLQDRNGLTDSALVTVFVQPDLATIRLGAAMIDGTPITSVTVGQSFLLQGFVQDLSPVAGGIFAAYLDVVYPGTAASVNGQITYGDDFPNGRSGSTSVAGLIDEVGAFDGLDQLGPNEALLFSVPMRADQAGTFTFSTNPADVLPQHNVLLFDRDDPVPTDQIEFRTLSLSIVQALAAKTNPRNAMDVNDDTSISPLDALLVINELNGSTLAARAEGESSALYLDVSADGSVSPLDALLVINELNRINDAQANDAPLAALAAALDTSAMPDKDTDKAPIDAGTVEVVTGTAGKPLELAMNSTSTLFDAVHAGTDSDVAADIDDELGSTLNLIGEDLLKRRV